MKFRVTRWAGRAVTICQRCAERSEPELLDRRIDLWQRQHACDPPAVRTPTAPVSGPLARVQPESAPTPTSDHEGASQTTQKERP